MRQLLQHTNTIMSTAQVLQQGERSAQLTRCVRYSNAVDDGDVRHVNCATAAVRIARLRIGKAVSCNRRGVGADDNAGGAAVHLHKDLASEGNACTMAI